MKIILKHIIKNMYEKKLRTFIMLLTILLSTMVLFIGLSLNDILNNTYASMTKGTYGDGNILVSKSTDEHDPLFNKKDFVTKSIDIEERLDLIQTVGKSEVDGNNVKVSLIGLDLDKASDMNIIQPINVPEDFTLKENETLISSRTATDYNLNLGDKITVDTHHQIYTYTVGAISETSGLYYSETKDMLLVVTMNQVHDMYGSEDVVNQVLLQVDEDKTDYITKTLADQHTHLSVQPTKQLDTVQRDEETFQTAIALAIVIIVMISTYVIFSLAKIIVSERMPVVGTFRSVGASKRMINWFLRMEFLFYGIVGAVIGILLAILLLPIAADNFNEYKAFGAETVVSYNPVYIIVALTFGAIFPVIGGTLHIYRSSKRPLKEMILHTSHIEQVRSKKSLFIGIFLLGSSLGLYFLNKQDNLLLAIGAVLTLFIAIVLLMPTILNRISIVTNVVFKNIQHGEIKLGIKNIANNKIVANNTSMIIVVFLLLLMIGNTSAGIDQYIKNTVEQDFDIMVEETDMNFSTYENIETVEGVSDSYMQHISQANYDIRDEHDTFIVYGVEDIETFDQFYSGATFLSDAKTNLSSVNNGIILDEYQANRYDLDVGDRISLEPLDKDEQPIHEEERVVEIAGTMEAASLTTNRNIIIMPLDYYKDHFMDTFNQLVVKKEESIHTKMVKENIESHYANAGMTVQTFDELLGSQKETVDTLIRGVLLIILLGLIIGLLGISNNLLISFNERKKEYAVLYSVCMSRSQLIKMLMYEMVMTFVSVVIVGLATGLGMNIVWSRLLYAVGLKIQFSLNYELFFILSGVVFILLALATWIIVRKLTKLDVLHELRYE